MGPFDLEPFLYAVERALHWAFGLHLLLTVSLLFFAGRWSDTNFALWREDRTLCFDCFRVFILFSVLAFRPLLLEGRRCLVLSSFAFLGGGWYPPPPKYPPIDFFFLLFLCNKVFTPPSSHPFPPSPVVGSPSLWALPPPPTGSENPGGQVSRLHHRQGPSQKALHCQGLGCDQSGGFLRGPLPMAKSWGPGSAHFRGPFRGAPPVNKTFDFRFCFDWTQGIAQ